LFANEITHQANIQLSHNFHSFSKQVNQKQYPNTTTVSISFSKQVNQKQYPNTTTVSIILFQKYFKKLILPERVFEVHTKKLRAVKGIAKDFG
jgi:hypothetical protein